MSRMIVFLVLLFLAEPALATPLSSTELLTEADKYNGQLIEFEGEVVGDLMVRGEHIWVPVNDGGNTFSVWVPAFFAKQIKHVGGYRYRGDQVRVQGVFYRSCPEHGGGLDIHAEDFRVIKPGHKIPYLLDWSRVFVVLILGFLAFAFFLVNHYIRKKNFL